MDKKIKINTIKEKKLINNKGKLFYIVEVQPEVIFILDEDNNFICNYCGTIDEDDDNLRVINLH